MGRKDIRCNGVGIIVVKCYTWMAENKVMNMKEEENNTNRWIELMDEELRSQLDPSYLKSLEHLEKIVANNEEPENLEVDERGVILVRSGQAEITLDVVETFSWRLAYNDNHLAVRIGVQGFPDELQRADIIGSEELPIGDSCTAFVLLAIVGFPEGSVPENLIEKIEWANRFAEEKEDEDGNEDDQ